MDELLLDCFLLLAFFFDFLWCFTTLEVAFFLELPFLLEELPQATNEQPVSKTVKINPNFFIIVFHPLFDKK